MARAFATAAFVFLFMAFLAAQAATGFMRDMFESSVYPRALRAIDWILETFLTGLLGQTVGAALLLVLGLVFAAAILRQAIRGGGA